MAACGSVFRSAKNLKSKEFRSQRIPGAAASKCSANSLGISLTRVKARLRRRRDVTLQASPLACIPAMWNLSFLFAVHRSAAKTRATPTLVIANRPSVSAYGDSHFRTYLVIYYYALGLLGSSQPRARNLADDAALAQIPFPLPIVASYLFFVHFNVIVPSVSRSTQWYFSIRLTRKYLTGGAILLRSCYMPGPPQSIRDFVIFITGLALSHSLWSSMSRNFLRSSDSSSRSKSPENLTRHFVLENPRFFFSSS